MINQDLLEKLITDYLEAKGYVLADEVVYGYGSPKNAIKEMAEYIKENCDGSTR